MSDEIAGRGVKVTVKYGKGYEEPWVSFAGLPSEVRQDMIDLFQVDPARAEKLTTGELILDVAHMATTMRVLATELGATVIKGDGAADGDKAKPAKKAPAKKAAAKKAEPKPEASAEETKAEEPKADDGPPWNTDEKPAETASDDPWAAAAADQGDDASQSAAAEPEKPNAALYSAIESSADVNALKLLWADNQQAFADDADLLAAWKAKGKALKAA